MPFSWFRVPSNTSKKLHDCLNQENAGRLNNEDHSKVSVESCIRQIIERDNGARVDGKILFEASGKFAHVHVEYDDNDARLNLIVDLEAEQAVELVSAEELDTRINARYQPS